VITTAWRISIWIMRGEFGELLFLVDGVRMGWACLPPEGFHR
jgi:hypothetical protein